ncbi:3739_t:CDS:2, partial [Cetraspora pellucida]
HVALVSVFFESKSFEKYDYNKEETIKKPEFLSVLYRSSANYKETEYKIQLLNIDQEKLNIPSTDYSVIINMPSDELKRLFSDQNVIYETVKITVKQNKKIVRFTSLDNLNNECINILKEKKGGLDNEITIKAGIILTIYFYLNICCCSQKHHL